MSAIDQHPPANPPEEAVILPENVPASAEKSGEVFSISRDLINYLIIAALFLGLGVVLGMNMGDSGVTSQQVRVIVEDVVRETVQQDIARLQEAMLGLASGGDIDSEALSALVQSAVADAVASNVDFMADDDPFWGPEDAPVVMVEFSDFLCSFCGRHYQNTLMPLLENYDGYIRYVYRDFPGVGGQNAIESALAAECANDQGLFWEYHNVLFENQSSLATNDMSQLATVLEDHARNVGMDMDAYTECYESRVHLADIIQDASDAQAAGARGTPGFLINGTFVSGAQPYDVFASLIDAELKEQGIVRETTSS